MPPAAAAPALGKRKRARLSGIIATALILGAVTGSTPGMAFRRAAGPMAKRVGPQQRRQGAAASASAFTALQHHHQQRQQQRALNGGLLARLRTALAASLQDEEVDPGVVEGTDLRVVKYPDPRLRAANAEVAPEEFGPELQKLAKDMFKVMYAANGVGLAAPQVGVNKRLMVFNPDGDKLKWLSEVVLVNPRIVEKSSKTDVMEEGCLSFPGMAGDVERALTIKVAFQDAKGKAKTKKFRDWEARIFQHEYDHLDGVVYIDRLSPEGREKVQPVLDKLIADFGSGGAL